MRFFTRIFFLISLVVGVSPSLAEAATLSLVPSSGAYSIGTIFNVNIALDTTGSQIQGTDIHYLNYNPAVLEMQDDNASASGVQITPGSLMPNTILNSVDAANGKIDFSQITSGGQSYSGSSTLATIRFKALAAGTASVTFNFTSGSTTDTNVASNGADVLTSAFGGSYTLSLAPGQTPIPTPVPTNTVIPAPATTPVSTPALTPIPSPSSSSSSSSSSSISGGSSNSNITIPIALPVGKRQPYSFTRTLKRGSKGNDVAQLQMMLNELTFPIGTVDGGFGKKTATGVKSFQSKNALVADGVFGKKSAAQLNALWTGGEIAPAPSAGTALVRTLRYGMRGEDVKTLQKMLNQFGFTMGTPSGAFGPKTTASVKAFQKKYDLTADGIAGLKTLKKITELAK